MFIPQWPSLKPIQKQQAKAFVFIKIFFDGKLEDKDSARNVSRLLQLLRYSEDRAS
jgi:hypothetical protein